MPDIISAPALFYWVPKIFFVIIFLIVGLFSLRKKMITERFIFWLFILYFFERYIEIGLRVVVSFYQTLDEGYTSLAYKFFLSTLRPSIEEIIAREAVMVLIATTIWLLLYLYAKKTAFKKIDIVDVSIFAFGTLIAGWPNFLVYIGLVFALSLLGLLIQQLFKKEASRMIVTPYFAVAGIIVIFWGWDISQLVGLYAIR